MSNYSQEDGDRGKDHVLAVQNTLVDDERKSNSYKCSEELEFPNSKQTKQEQEQNAEEFLQDYDQVYHELNSGMYEVRLSQTEQEQQAQSSNDLSQTQNKNEECEANDKLPELQNPSINQQSQLNQNQENALDEPSPLEQEKVLQELLQQRLGIKHSEISYPSIEIEDKKPNYQQVESQEEGEGCSKQAVKYEQVCDISEDDRKDNQIDAQQKEEHKQDISHQDNTTDHIADIQKEELSKQEILLQNNMPQNITNVEERELQDQKTDNIIDIQQREEPKPEILHQDNITDNMIKFQVKEETHISHQIQISSKLERQSTSTSQIHFDQVNIIGYDKTFFFKIQTQIYQIEVKRNRKIYTIKRRFMDFALLYKLALIQFSGFILYPFPRKTLQIFKQLKFSIGDQLQKMLSIEKRILQLQKFLQFLIGHREIGQSRLISSFLTQEHGLYTIVMANLEAKINEQEKQYELGIITQNYNSLKSIVIKGFSLFQNYIHQSPSRGNQSPRIQQQLQIEGRQLQQQYQPIKKQLASCKQRAHHFYERADRLRQIYKTNSQVCNIESNIDSILILSSKLTSSKSYYEKYYEWIEDNILFDVKYFISLFEQIEEQIAYRSSLLNKIGHSAVQIDKIKKILQKVQLFDSRFLPDWNDNLLRFQQSQQHIYKEFAVNWKNHCLLMSKIWK